MQDKRKQAFKKKKLISRNAALHAHTVFSISLHVCSPLCAASHAEQRCCVSSCSPFSLPGPSYAYVSKERPGVMHVVTTLVTASFNVFTQTVYPQTQA